MVLRRRLLLSLAALATLTACSTPPTPRGEVRGEASAVDEIAQSDTNRMATLAMRENLDSLSRLADKLYRRNPAEWRRAGHATREAALEHLNFAIRARLSPASLQGQRDIAALALSLSPQFAGDRVEAFIYANADMLITAHGDRTRFHLLDSLDAQHLFNAARNIETAIWLLATRRTASGQPLLLADELSPQERNLSFEREFGKIVGRLDLLAVVLTEKYRRAAIGYVQSLFGGQFLQFLPVR
jgi:hypothetical protein